MCRLNPVSTACATRSQIKKKTTTGIYLSPIYAIMFETILKEKKKRYK